MATKYDVIQRPGVRLAYDDPMSGWEALASALGEYGDPQYQLQLKEDRREDARVHLAGKRFDELQEQNDLAEARQKKNDRINAQNAEQQKLTFDQAQKDRDFNLEKEFYDDALLPFNQRGDTEGALEFLDTFVTSNPRLSAIAKQKAKSLTRSDSQLTSAIDELATIAPGLIDKYGRNALKGMLAKNHNAIAEQMILGEIGEITQGKEREYESHKSILAAQIEQLKLTLPGSQARIDLTSAMNSTIEDIRKYGGIDVPAGGGGDPLGDIEDIVPQEAGFDVGEMLGALFSEEKEKKLFKKEKEKLAKPDYFVGKFNKDLKKLSKIKSGEGMYAFGSATDKRKREITKIENSLKKSVASFYHPVEGFKNSKFEKAFKKRYKGKDYHDMIKYFDSLFEYGGETTAGDLLSEWVAQEAGKPWPKDFYKTQPGYEPSP